MRWEYAIEPLVATHDGALKALLDSKGREGWELATIVQQGSGTVAVFKRAVDAVARTAA